MLPPLTLRYLEEFTDDTGLFQHAKYSVPDRRKGYSTDDNARALIVVSKHYDVYGWEVSIRLARIYLSFLYYMQRKDGFFYNKLSYDRQRKWDVNDDSYGRSMWGCAALYSSHMPDKLRLLAKELLDSSLKAVKRLRAPRGMAFTILALHEYHSKVGDEGITELISRLAWNLVELYEGISDDSWKWFEDVMTYENARLPQALFLAYDATRERRFLEVATESFDFLCKVTLVNGMFWPIGNRGWYKRGGLRALYDQQPVEAGSMVEAALTGFEVTGKEKYIKIAKIAMEWYLGRNSARLKLYDEETGGCYDGINPYGLNFNQGAESALSYLLARLKFEEVQVKLGYRLLTASLR
ncbi:MAG: glycosyltransferase [Thermoprotei archaeon]|nr:glycosyltransferase [Thermoprotei archaeon]